MRQFLREWFGYADFRPGQQAVIDALMAGRSTLAIFPTGGGKSLCYQLPALRLEGITVVVSPLIALMKDQVDALVARGVAAARLDSTLSDDEVAALESRLSAGEIKLLYLAPERLGHPAWRQRLQALPIELMAIDEAHCISQWGHNFRPDYLKLAVWCRKAKVPRVLALTATATPKVAREIRRQFKIRAEDQIQLSFHRSNLDLRVTPCSAEARPGILLESLAAIVGPVVVYVTRQETAEQVATWLAQHGQVARAYHAGLPVDCRSEVQEAFMAGSLRVIVATLAFGMGIDKSDIRGVIHYNLPKSLEHYIQEIGRSGRDGLPAVCEMLACSEDLTRLENFIYGDTPSERAMENLLQRVMRMGTTFAVSPYELATTCDIRSEVVATIFAYLELLGWIEASGMHYDTYKARWVRPMAQILAGRSPRERLWIEQVMAAGESSRWGLMFHPTAMAEQLGVRRERIVSCLEDLRDAGELGLSASGVRHAYRLKRPIESPGELARELAMTFAAREQADLERLAQVAKLPGYRGCLTGYLTKHFGETLKGPCGHCDRCRGVPAQRMAPRSVRALEEGDFERVGHLLREGHAALGSARQLARFLCGVTSPAAQRSRLNRHADYGFLGDQPFAEVMVFAEAVSGG